MPVPRKKNVAGFYDEQGRFRPIRKPSFVGAQRRKAKPADRKKYSRAKAGDLGKRRQFLAREDVFDREIRLQRKQDEKLARIQEREMSKAMSDAIGDQDSAGPGKTLVEFVRSSGGIRPTFKHRGKKFKGHRESYDFGELEPFTLKQSGKRGLVSEKGKKTLDGMYQAAREAGYAVNDTWDLLDAMDNEIKNGKAMYANYGYLDYRDNPKSDLYVSQLGPRSFGVFLKTYLLKKFATKAAAETYIRSVRSRAKVKPNGKAAQAAKAAISIFDNDLDLDLDAKDVARLAKAEKGKRRRKTAKKNPDALTTFAMAAGGIASALQIKQMLNTGDGEAKKKRRGTKTAQLARVAKNPHGEAPSGVKYNEKLFDRDLAAIEEGNFRVVRSANAHGRLAGYSKREVEWLIDRAKLAARLRTKLNPADMKKLAPKLKTNGVMKRMLSRRKAASALKRELRLERALEKTRAKKSRAVKAAVANPKKPAAKANPPASAGKGKAAVTRSKGNPIKVYEFQFGKDRDPIIVQAWSRMEAWKSLPTKARLDFAKANGKVIVHDFEKYHREFDKRSKKANPKRTAPAVKKAVAGSRRVNPKPVAKAKTPSRSRKANPTKPPRSRLFEKFQGRPVTKGVQREVSAHAPAKLVQLGDLIELRVKGLGPIKTNPKAFKLTAANGKLWIVGGKIAKPNPAAKVNEINPIGELTHVVYGTRKPHHGDHQYTHYIHKMGEESGKAPLLCVDRDGYPVLRGGNYKIEARGIVD